MKGQTKTNWIFAAGNNKNLGRTPWKTFSNRKRKENTRTVFSNRGSRKQMDPHITKTVKQKRRNRFAGISYP